jgi:hypothetical protein
MIFWRNPDTCASLGGGRLSSEILSSIEEMKLKDTAQIPAYGCFFPGVSYLFPENSREMRNAHNREVKNLGCTGHSIILDPREELEKPDDLSKPYRFLKYPPLCIYVKPDGPPIGDVCRSQVAGAPCPPDCIPMTPMQKSFNVKAMTSRQTEGIPEDVQIFDELPFLRLEKYELTIKRKGISLQLAYCVTDYFAQGMSFRGAPWLLHLSLPDNRAVFSRANLLIPLSRPSLWSQLKLLTPLWPPDKPSAKDKYLKAVMEALKPDEEYLAEMARANECAVSDYMTRLREAVMGYVYRMLA